MARTDIRVSAIIIRENKILLMHRFKKGEEYYIFPGGGVEDEETWEETLMREVKEETNLDVLNYELAFISADESNNKEYPYFSCKVSEGNVEIIGEEKDLNTPDNSYELVWIDLSQEFDINLVPKNAKHQFIKMYVNKLR